MKQVKITVLKTSFERDLAERYAMPGLGPCTAMKEGQVFYTDLKKPDGFCDTAWKCIFQYVFALANGGGADGFFYGDWVREPYTAVSCCNDGLRPVYFKIELAEK